MMPPGCRIAEPVSLPARPPAVQATLPADLMYTALLL